MCGRVGDVTPPLDDRYAPPGGAQNRIIRQLRIAVNDRLFVLRALALFNVEGDEDLLPILAALYRGCHLRGIQAIGFEQLLDSSRRLGYILVVERRAQN